MFCLHMIHFNGICSSFAFQIVYYKKDSTIVRLIKMKKY
jgi:hypothetical protein